MVKTVPIPPKCPECDVMLWKDMTRVTPATPNHWHWYCTKCSRRYRPSEDHWRTFSHGTPTGSSSAVRGQHLSRQ